MPHAATLRTRVFDVSQDEGETRGSAGIKTETRASRISENEEFRKKKRIWVPKNRIAIENKIRVRLLLAEYVAVATWLTRAWNKISCCSTMRLQREESLSRCTRETQFANTIRVSLKLRKKYYRLSKRSSLMQFQEINIAFKNNVRLNIF